MLRLLHTADWQIGRVFSQFDPDDAAALHEARFTVVTRLAEIAASEQVDAVLVAGDVFDAQGVSDKTIRRLFNATAGFSGLWLLIPGNHDAALTESVWSRARRLGGLPANVVPLLEPAPFVIPGKAAVLPAPLAQRHTYGDLTDWFDTAHSPEGLPRIGVAHGSVQGILAEDIDSPNPIAADRPETARLDYLALGDWHGTKQISARCWYSGTPETDRFRTNESGNALLVTIAGAGAPPEVTAVRTGAYRWIAQEHQLIGPTDVDEALRHVDALGSQDVAHVRLTGMVDLAGHRRLSNCAAAAGARVRALVWDDTRLRPEPTDSDLAALRADGYIGEVLRHLRSQQAQAEQSEVARDALLALAGVLSPPTAPEEPTAPAAAAATARV